MRPAFAWGAGAMALAVSACSATPSAPGLPLTVGDGIGSQYGNYAARTDGEMLGPSGERCIVFTWDRPLTADLAFRLRSASCDSTEHPGRMVCTELSRSVIPIGEGRLNNGPDESRQ